MAYPLDIRQSENWSKYLGFLGWESVRTSNGVNVEIKKLPIFSVLKVQRPRGLGEEDLVEIEKIGKKYRALFVKIEPGLEQKDMEIFRKSRYVEASPLVPPSTFFLNLQNADLWKGLSRSCKYSIKRAEREGGKVDIYTKPDEKELREFYEIIRSTGKRKGFYIQNFEDLKKKVEIFGDSSFLITGKTEEGLLTIGYFYLAIGKNVWYIHGGSTEHRKGSKVGYLTFWKAIEFFSKNGFEIMDFEGAYDARFPKFTKNWEGFTHFKEKFGAEKVQFPKAKIKFTVF